MSPAATAVRTPGPNAADTGPAAVAMRIADITVDPRYRRRDLGKLRDLQRSIRDEGLLRPVPVTADGMLIAGERRVAACRNLGWDTIPVIVADDETEAVELLAAEHRDHHALGKPRSASELVLLGIEIEAFEHVGAEIRQHNGRIGRPNDSSHQSRDTAAAIIGMSMHYYTQIRPIAMAARGYETTPGGVSHVAVDAEWAHRSQDTLDVLDRIQAGEHIDYVSPTGRRAGLTVNAVYTQWRRDRDARYGAPVMRNAVFCTPGPDGAPKRQAPQRAQREALDKATASLTGLCHGLDSIGDIDPSITRQEAAQYMRDLSNAARMLRNLHNKIKEYAHGIA